MKSIDYFLGEACKLLFPIDDEIFFGNRKSSISICTLASLNLLREIANSKLMNDISLVGRLFSENKGIDSIIEYINSKPGIQTLIICGEDVSGHRSGASLLALQKFGTDENGKIIHSISRDPNLKSSKQAVEKFRKKVRIIDKIGLTNLEKIVRLVDSIKN